MACRVEAICAIRVIQYTMYVKEKGKKPYEALMSSVIIIAIYT